MRMEEKTKQEERKNVVKPNIRQENDKNNLSRTVSF